MTDVFLKGKRVFRAQCATDTFTSQNEPHTAGVGLVAERPRSFSASG